MAQRLIPAVIELINAFNLSELKLQHQHIQQQHRQQRPDGLKLGPKLPILLNEIKRKNAATCTNYKCYHLFIHKMKCITDYLIAMIGQILVAICRF